MKGTTSPFDEHDLGAFGWTSALRQGHKDTFVFEENGSEVVLKLSGLYPKMQDGGDRECLNSTLPSTAGAALIFGGQVAKVSAEAGSVCVYLTRCPAARALTVDDYKKSYCIINDGYAGVCCPKSQVQEKTS